MIAYHCDYDDCDTWETPATGTFLVVKWMDTKLHFCSWDCVLKYSATFEPLESYE